LHLLRKLLFALLVFVAFLLTAWAAAALYFDFQVASLQLPLAVLYLVLMLGGFFCLRHRAIRVLVLFAGFVVVAFWWFSLKPTNHRNWQPDNAQTAWADIDGDHITIHNFRNCSYVTELDYTCQWETRSFDLANLTGADIFITWWGPTLIAHPITSFDFGPQGHVPVSIETRDVVGQSYSAVRGFFRQYELAYIVSDERDVVRLRTNFRKDEEVYLFRTTVRPEFARKIFLAYLQRVNELHNNPEWYNALTNNCTTNIDVSASEARDRKTVWDWRVLLNGKMDEMMYENGALVTGGLSLPALKAQAHINAAAKAADDSPDWSQLIRVGRVGFTNQPARTTSAP
jgi:hypothetical protein